MKKEKRNNMVIADNLGYDDLVGGIQELFEHARHSAARSVNAIMTATYWEIGLRIVEYEQSGQTRAAYGAGLLEKLAEDLAARFGRGFSRHNLARFRDFYLAFSPEKIRATLSLETGSRDGNEKRATVSSEFKSLDLSDLAQAFPLPWSHYVLLVRNTRSKEALDFYLAEALRGGWSVRQLNITAHGLVQS